MTREDQLRLCEICTQRKMDLSRGLVCSLTNEYASFTDTCQEFEEDEKEREQVYRRHMDATGDIKIAHSTDYKFNINLGVALILLWLALMIVRITIGFRVPFIPGLSLLAGIYMVVKGKRQESVHRKYSK